MGPEEQNDVEEDARSVLKTLGNSVLIFTTAGALTGGLVGPKVLQGLGSLGAIISDELRSFETLMRDLCFSDLDCSNAIGKVPVRVKHML